MAGNMVRLKPETWARLTRLRGKVMVCGETWTYDRTINALLDAIEAQEKVSADGELIMEIAERQDAGLENAVLP